MTKPDIDAAAALRALASDDSVKSKIGRVRGLMDEIETAQRSGVSNTKIVETLNEKEFGLTLKSFEMMLYRIRKERGFSKSQIATTSTPSQPVQRQKDEPQTVPDEDESSVALDKKQRREKLADKFIKPEVTNPLLRRIKEQNK